MRCVLPFALVFAACAGLARAQVTEEGKKAAAHHYRVGLAAMSDGRYGEAAHEFEAAYRVMPDVAFLYNLGQAYRNAKQPAKALAAYQEYLLAAPNAPNRPKVEGYIEDLLEQGIQPAAPPAAPPPKPVLEAPPPAPPAPIASPLVLSAGPAPRRSLVPMVIAVAAAVVAVAAIGLAVGLYATRPSQPFSLESAR